MNLESSFYDERPHDRDWGPTVLIVDDDEPDRARLEDICSSTNDAQSLHVIVRSSIEGALQVIASTPVHVVLLDKSFEMGAGLPPRNSIDVIPKMLEMQPHLQILIITGSNAIDDAVKAMRSGACGYVTKEKPNRLLIEEINRAIHVAKLTIDKIRTERGENSSPSSIQIVGESEIAKYLTSQIQAVARSPYPVLLLGPTGTGKTTIARMIHEERRKFLRQEDRPFFRVHLGAMPQGLIESELFGHEKGAFSGAIKAKQGYFELVNSGTLFLDEIGEISPDLQVKLLKVLDNKGRFNRVGGADEYSSAFKLVCATNRDLEQMVAQGQFREDLFMRISTFPIRVPSLEERKKDIPDIIRAILPEYCKEHNVSIEFDELPSDFVEALTNEPPHGNIRGIQEQLARLIVYSPKEPNGKPILKNWRDVPGLSQKRGTKLKTSLSLRDLTTLPYDVVPENGGGEFPGFTELLEEVADKIVDDAHRKFKKQTDIAKALKISKSAAHYRLRRLEKDKEPNSQSADKVPVQGALGVSLG